MPFFAGTFLVAKPVLKDASFKQTVILLLRHDADGAFGLVVNRPAEADELPFPVFTGGPCPCPGLLMVHGHADWMDALDENSGKQVAPGIYLGDADCFRRVSEPDPEVSYRFRLFKGYAGWGAGQLEGEIAQGAWAVVPASADVLFDTPSEELWGDILPPSIPQPSVN